MSTVPAFDDPESEDLMNELAGLSPVAYDRIRKQAAESIGVRASALDKEIEQRRRMLGKPDTENSGVTFPEVDAWPVSVDGSEVLNELFAVITSYVKLPRDAALAVCLWVILTYVHDCIHVSAILAITSPQKRCGKTTLLSLLSRLVCRALPTNNITPAALFRTIEKHTPTLLIDEADTFLGQNDELRGIVNSGHTKETAFVIRTVGDDHEPARFSTWGPKAIALIGKLPDTLNDRAIVIRLERKRSTDKVKRLRSNGDELIDLRAKVRRWAEDHAEWIETAESDMPEGLHDRAADNWEPLLAISDLAGGEWPLAARRAALALTGAEPESDNIEVQLLWDVRSIFARKGITFCRPGDLHTELVNLEDRPWSEWRKGQPITKRRIGDMLHNFGVRSRSGRHGEWAGRAYWFDDLKDAFSRYLPDPPADYGTTLQHRKNSGLKQNDNGTNADVVPQEKSTNRLDLSGCSVVPHSRGVEAAEYEPGQDC